MDVAKEGPHRFLRPGMQVCDQRCCPIFSVLARQAGPKLQLFAAWWKQTGTRQRVRSEPAARLPCPLFSFGRWQLNLTKCDCADFWLLARTSSKSLYSPTPNVYSNASGSPIRATSIMPSVISTRRFHRIQGFRRSFCDNSDRNHSIYGIFAVKVNLIQCWAEPNSDLPRHSYCWPLPLLRRCAVWVSWHKRHPHLMAAVLMRRLPNQQSRRRAVFRARRSFHRTYRLLRQLLL